jgi:hypothetical protein
MDAGDDPAFASALTKSTSSKALSFWIRLLKFQSIHHGHAILGTSQHNKAFESAGNCVF